MVMTAIGISFAVDGPPPAPKRPHVVDGGSMTWTLDHAVGLASDRAALPVAGRPSPYGAAAQRRRPVGRSTTQPWRRAGRRSGDHRAGISRSTTVSGRDRAPDRRTRRRCAARGEASPELRATIDPATTTSPAINSVDPDPPYVARTPSRVLDDHVPHPGDVAAERDDARRNGTHHSTGRRLRIRCRGCPGTTCTGARGTGRPPAPTTGVPQQDDRPTGTPSPRTAAISTSAEPIDEPSPIGRCDIEPCSTSEFRQHRPHRSNRSVSCTGRNRPEFTDSRRPAEPATRWVSRRRRRTAVSAGAAPIWCGSARRGSR